MKRCRVVGLLMVLLVVPPRAHALGNKGFESLQVFSRVLHNITEHYVDSVSEEALVWAAIQGMLEALDPHSAYLTPQLYRSLKSETAGQFGGIGTELTVRRGWLTVIAPIDGSPAARAGIRSGDRIVKINDVSTKAMAPSESAARMRGRPGSSITLTVVRGKADAPFTVTMKREQIKFPSVRSQWLEPGYLYLRVTSFQEQTLGDFKMALEKAGQQGKISGLLVDLRNNPGGLLDQAVGICDLFLKEGVILTTISRGREIGRHDAHPDGTEPLYPIVLLVNGGSASAAEIVAGALQDRARALLVGTQTFGKGSVQTVMPMDDGSALKLTIARYYTPSKRSIQAHGIAPDVIVPEEQGKRASDDADAEGRLPRHVPGAEGRPQRGRVRLPLPAIQLAAGDDDYQRAAGLALLKNGAAVRSTTIR